jgi:ribonuclease Z
LKTSQISRIFITHLHGDHVYGLPGLLATRSLAGDPKRIDLYGPSGLDGFVQAMLGASYTRLGFPVEVHSVETGVIFEDDRFSVRCAPLEHRIPTFGYRVDEKSRAGAFDVERAAALGIAPGPIYGILKRGETVTLADGRVIDGRSLVGPPEPGRSIAYCTDTIPCATDLELAREADVLVHEATFSGRDGNLAQVSLHSTAASAAEVARDAAVGHLLLTHLSSRYARGSEIGPQDILAEARAIFPNTALASDLMTTELPRHR